MTHRLFYHVTPTRNVESIKLIGLRPTSDGGLLMRGEVPRKAVFLARTQSDALEQLLSYRDEAKLPLIRHWTLLRVRLPVDTAFLEDESECEYVTISIPPSDVQVVKHFDLLRILKSEGVPEELLRSEFDLE